MVNIFVIRALSLLIYTVKSEKAIDLEKDFLLPDTAEILSKPKIKISEKMYNFLEDNKEGVNGIKTILKLVIKDSKASLAFLNEFNKSLKHETVLNLPVEEDGIKFDDAVKRHYLKIVTEILKDSEFDQIRDAFIKSLEKIKTFKLTELKALNNFDEFFSTLANSLPSNLKNEFNFKFQNIKNEISNFVQNKSSDSLKLTHQYDIEIISKEIRDSIEGLINGHVSKYFQNLIIKKLVYDFFNLLGYFTN
jgi:hypothetical protein